MDEYPATGELPTRDPAVPSTAADDASLAPAPPAELLAGRYRLLERIGEGGMGSVWLAEQREPVKRRVAVKLIKPGMDSRAVLARFEAERQALALMDHPHIARVLDGGSTSDGRPFFVMELVSGSPVTEYCDERRLSLEERLEVFSQICAAVQHAHQKGVIHRDIKPSNVLVAERDGEPVAKVIDFGLAKALHAGASLTDRTLHTAFGAVVGTPLYMAPEQLAGAGNDVDTRSDVYSLGVLLYELLTGTTPCEPSKLKRADWDEVRRMLREDEPPRPSTRLSSSAGLPAIASRRGSEPRRLNRRVRGDLDWIAMKALEKDPSRRYATADALLRDVRRFLADEPIEARPPSFRYRVGKFVSKRRGPVIASAAALAILVAGALGTTWGWLRALDAERGVREALRRVSTEQRNTQRALDAVVVEQAKTAAALKQSEAERVRAVAAESDAAAQARRAFATFYNRQMNLAAHDWDRGAVASLRARLESTRPERTGGADLRGWEWHYWERLTRSELKTLGPKGPVEDEAAIRGDADPLGRARYGVTRVAFAPDGTRVASAWSDGTVRIWNVATGEVEREWNAHPEAGAVSAAWQARGTPGGTTSLAFSPTGDRLATLSLRELALWDPATGERLHSYGANSGGLRVAFSPDGATLATVRGDYTRDGSSRGVGREGTPADPVVSLWSADGDRAPREGLASPGAVASVVAFLPRENRVLVAGGIMNPREVDLVAFWDANGHRKLWSLTQGAPVTAAAVGPSERRIALVRLTRGYGQASDSALDLHFAETGALERSLVGHTTRLTAVAFSPDERRVAATGDDGACYVWELGDASATTPPRRLVGHRDVATSVAFSPDGRTIATGSVDGTVKIWDAAATPGRRVHWVGPQAANLSFNRAGTQFVDDGRTHAPIVRHGRSGRAELVLRGHGGYAVGAVHTPDGSKIITHATDETLRWWDAATGRLLDEATVGKPVTGAAWTLAISPDGRRLAVFLQGEGVRMLEAATGRPDPGWLDRRVNGQPLFSPDGSRLVVASAGARRVTLYDAATGEPGLSIETPSAPLGVAFDAKGERLATVDDRTIHLWSAKDGRRLASLEGGQHAVTSLAFSRDGRRLLSCALDGRARLWDLATGDEVLEIELGDAARSAFFSPDETEILAIVSMRLTRVGDLRPWTRERRVEQEGESLARFLLDERRVAPSEALTRAAGDETVTPEVRAAAIAEIRAVEAAIEVHRAADLPMPFAPLVP